MTAWTLAWREMRRSPLRTLLMALGVAAAAAGMTLATLLLAGAREGARRMTGRLGADLMVVPKGEHVARNFHEALLSGKPTAFYLDADALDRVARVPGVAALSAQTFVETLSNARCCAGEFFVVGFDPASDFTVTPWVREADWRDRTGTDDWMLVGDRILLRVGEEAALYGTAFTVAGVLEPTGAGMDWTIYVPDAALRRMNAHSSERAEAPARVPARAASALFIKAAPGEDLIDLAERIESAAPGTQAILASTVGAVARRQIAGIAGVLAAMVVGLWALALALSAVIFSQAVRERRSEIGLLKARGADRRFVWKALAQECGLVAAGSSVAGCLAACALIFAFRAPLAETLGAAEVLPGARRIATLTVSLAILVSLGSVLAALAAATPVLRMDPYEALRGGRPA